MFKYRVGISKCHCECHHISSSLVLCTFYLLNLYIFFAKPFFHEMHIWFTDLLTILKFDVKIEHIYLSISFFTWLIWIPSDRSILLFSCITNYNCYTSLVGAEFKSSFLLFANVNICVEALMRKFNEYS